MHKYGDLNRGADDWPPQVEDETLMPHNSEYGNGDYATAGELLIFLSSRRMTFLDLEEVSVNLVAEGKYRNRGG